jgi:hypothetical protein
MAHPFGDSAILIDAVSDPIIPASGLARSAESLNVNGALRTTGVVMLLCALLRVTPA